MISNHMIMLTPFETLRPTLTKAHVEVGNHATGPLSGKGGTKRKLYTGKMARNGATAIREARRRDKVSGDKKSDLGRERLKVVASGERESCSS